MTLRKIVVNDKSFFVPDGSKVTIDYGKKTTQIICTIESCCDSREEGRTSRGTSESQSPISQPEKCDSSQGCECCKLQAKGQKLERKEIPSNIRPFQYRSVYATDYVLNGKRLFSE